MGIERLVRLVAPPQHRQQVSTDWAQIETTLGTTLPTDYKLIADLYGPGVFGDTIVLNTPSTRLDIDFLSRANRESEFFRNMVEGEEDKERYYPIYPARDGILAWGYTTGACHYSGSQIPLQPVGLLWSPLSSPMLTSMNMNLPRPIS
jgi:hypothetical protein